MSRFRLLPALFGLLTLFLLSDAARAEEPDYLVGTEAEVAADERVKRALDTIVKVDFKQQTLADVATTLATAAVIDIEIIARTPENGRILAEIEITCQLRPLPLRAALRRLLLPLKLDYFERDGGLVIATHESDVHSELRVRVYPVADLISTPEPLPTPDAPQKKDTFDVPRQPSGYDPLIRVITTTLSPSEWSDLHGPGTIEPFDPAGGLVVTQTPRISCRDSPAARHAPPRAAGAKSGAAGETGTVRFCRRRFRCRLDDRRPAIGDGVASYRRW